jgi:hypothetical protein
MKTKRCHHLSNQVRRPPPQLQLTLPIQTSSIRSRSHKLQMCHLQLPYQSGTYKSKKNSSLLLELRLMRNTDLLHHHMGISKPVRIPNHLTSHQVLPITICIQISVRTTTSSMFLPVTNKLFFQDGSSQASMSTTCFQGLSFEIATWGNKSPLGYSEQ